MSKIAKLGCVVPLIFVVGLGLAVWVMDHVVPSSPIRALPASASGVREYYHDNFTGDYVRAVKANMTESDYHTYARSLGLTERFDPARDSDIENWIGARICGEAWWDPPRVPTFATHEVRSTCNPSDLLTELHISFHFHGSWSQFESMAS